MSDKKIPSQAEIEAEIKASHQELKEARILFEQHDADVYRGIISHSYYAMFHAAVALLWKRGFRPKKHKGTIQLFGQHVVQAGLAGEEYSDILRDGFDDRLLADYHVYAEDFNLEEIERMLENAGRFVGKMEELVNQEQKETK